MRGAAYGPAAAGTMTATWTPAGASVPAAAPPRSDEDDDDDEDEEAALAAELEKIRREREEARLRKEKEEAEQARKEKEAEALAANPLHNVGSAQVKRRWNDDVVFKNQARTEPERKKKFVNDTIRNEFHRRFLQKYIR
ncbi:unnamed protein product [Heterosigma akashiwo]